jgi:hypothetical protein
MTLQGGHPFNPLISQHHLRNLIPKSPPFPILVWTTHRTHRRMPPPFHIIRTLHSTAIIRSHLRPRHQSESTAHPSHKAVPYPLHRITRLQLAYISCDSITKNAMVNTDAHHRHRGSDTRSYVRQLVRIAGNTGAREEKALALTHVPKAVKHASCGRMYG